MPRIPPYLLLAFAALALTPPVLAVPDVTVTILPHEPPTTADDITLRIDFPNWAEARFDRAYIRHSGPSDNELFVHLENSCVLAACPRLDQVFEVPLGRLPADDYGYVIVLDGNDLERGSFRVEPGSVSPPPEGSRFDVATSPVAATDAQSVQLAIAAQTATCAPPTLNGVVREGSKFVAELEMPAAPPVFGPKSAPQPTCLPPAGGLLSGHHAELGQLPHGAYTAELRLRQDGQVTTVATHAFTVADEGDDVELLGRYKVAITWKTRESLTGPAIPVARSSTESALFSFFNLANWEVLVKVLDGCALNGHRWVFLTAATDVEFTMTVTDRLGEAPPYVYTRPAGLFTPPLADTAAFACAP